MAGDLIGENTGTVVGSYATGSVQAASSVGGLIGQWTDDHKVLNVTANSGIKLTSKRNAITKLGTDTTTSGPNKVTL
jgi:hypothetical protein